MNGIDDLIDLRVKGFQPTAVFVQLVPQPTAFGLNPDENIVTIQITPTERLEALDFRPLVALTVCVEDHTATRHRHRALAARIATFNPRCLWTAFEGDDELTVHIRRDGKPATTETYTA